MTRNYAVTKTGNEPPDDIDVAVVGYVNGEFERFRSQRNVVEDNWLEAWSLYLGTPEAIRFQRNQVLRSVGEVNNDWRHKINTGKAYECVETIHGYLMGAMFPNSEWFNAFPVAPGYSEYARIVKRYTANKLVESKFRAHYENFLRQLLILGNSVLALPWRYETRKWKKRVRVEQPVADEFLAEFGKRMDWEVIEVDKVIANQPDFETLDMFDVFLDGAASDPNNATFIRRIVKTKAEVLQGVKSGLYSNITGYEVVSTKPYTECEDNKNTLRRFQGVETEEPYSMGDTVELIEYWGDIHLDGETHHDMVATVLGDKLLRYESNPFWCGKPFIVGTVTQLTQTPYSIGTLQPNMGLLHELNIITNQRLDNLELSIDSMYTLKHDGVLQPEDVYTEPGKILLVSEHTDVQPVEHKQQFSVTYQEAALLEQTIDRNSGTGALISANNSRSGERVTAAEIQAVRDAGGNRLSNIHKHIEDTALLPILGKVFRLMQQFVTEDEVVRVSGAEPGSFEYIEFGPEELQHDFILKPIGADHVVDKDRYIKDRLDLLSALSQVPQMAERLNYETLAYDIISHFGFDEPDRYIIEPPTAVPQNPEGEPLPEGMPPQQMPTAGPPPKNLEDQLYEAGGKGMKAAMLAELQRDGGQSFAMENMGIDMSAAQPPMPPLPPQ